jgi:peptidoglycan/LPS O-acetylase OafA/YrhL
MTAVMLGLERAGFAAVGQWAFFAVLFAVTAGLSIAVSAALYALVEAPCIRLGRQIGRKMAAGQLQPLVQSQTNS